MLCSLALLKTRIGETGTANDDALRQVLAGAERSAVVYLGYDPTSATQPEYYSGEGSEFLVLRRKPVTAVASVYEDADGRYGETDDPFPADTLLTEGTEWVLRIDGGSQAGVLIRVGAFWPFSRRRPADRLGSELSPNHGSVKVTYTAGYTATQLADIAEAVYLEAAARWQSRLGIGTPQSESLAGRSLSFAQPQRAGGDRYSGPFVSLVARDVLRPHRLTPFA